MIHTHCYHIARVVGVAVTLIVISAASGTAQRPAGARLWIDAGASLGAIPTRGNPEFAGRKAARMVDLRLGTALSPSLRVGVQGSYLYVRDGITGRSILATLATLQYYPTERGPWVELGAGYQRYREALLFNEKLVSGVALETSVGYDVALSRSITVKPFVGLLVTTLTRRSVNGPGDNPQVLAPAGTPNVIQLGARLGWQH